MTAPEQRGGRRRAKVSEFVAREILHDIIDGGLAPGEMLPAEGKMLETYAVGRASLREALRILEIQGLITMKPGPGGGPIVGDADPHDLGRMAAMYFHVAGATFRELIEARLVMESMMAGVAARRRQPEFVAQLETSIRRATEAPPEDVVEYTRSALDFHSLVAGMSGNRILDLMGRALKELYTDRIRGFVFRPEERAEIMLAHERIAAAIAAGDAATAETLMRQHMEDFARNVETRFPGLMDEVVDWR